MSVRVGPFHHREVPELVRRKRSNPRFAGPIYHMPFPGHRTCAEWMPSTELSPLLDRFDQFAEYLAEDCEPVVAARLAGYQPSDAVLLMRLLRDKLGAQAR